MRLYPNQLARHLRGELRSLYILSGDEPLELQECADAIRAAARDRGFAERVRLQADSGFDWSEIAQYRDALGLFADKRIIDLRMPDGKPGLSGAKVLTYYAERPSPDNVLLISAGKLDGNDRRTKWYKALEEAGAAVTVRAVSTDALPGWIRQRAGRVNLSLTPEAVEALAERTEGNQLACAQELEKLRLLYGEREIGLPEVIESAAMSSRYTVYEMTDAALAGNTERTGLILRGLRAEGVAPPLVLWALTREIRSMARMAGGLLRGQSVDDVMAAARVWRDRAPLVESALRRRRPAGWYALLRRAARTDAAIKGGARTDPWDELERLALALGGVYILVRRPHRPLGRANAARRNS
ncbi:MAG: DNA polymerase III subunit delta [Gammaproteobacteria bacterium]